MHWSLGSFKFSQFLFSLNTHPALKQLHFKAGRVAFSALNMCGPRARVQNGGPHITCLNISVTHEANKCSFCLLPWRKSLHDNLKAWYECGTQTSGNLAQDPSRFRQSGCRATANHSILALQISPMSITHKQLCLNPSLGR